MISHDLLATASAEATDRDHLWLTVLDSLRPATVLELGVQGGAFAARLLGARPEIATYYMVDPWRQLENWNKPANKTPPEMAAFRRAALEATEFARERRVVLEGTTTEVIDQVPDASLDFAYVDGDHTLRGITIDLVSLWPKMRHGSVLAGDDFSPTVWQHDPRYEPTFVFPLAVHFAEAVGCPILGLRFNQFAILVDKRPGRRFAFADLAGAYPTTDLRDALRSPGAT